MSLGLIFDFRKEVKPVDNYVSVQKIGLPKT